MAKPRDRVVPRLIEDEMREAFIDYSMSVIVQRALPDVRDGLKPVHRRILYAMHEAGLLPTRAFKKSATVVGDVLGKYHPHGDSAVYDAMVRMVQDFSLRYPLVQGQGNFGSIDGDAAAAYRYTEARLSQVAVEMLSDIDKDTVDFRPNFDDRLSEPTVLPARVPNLLVNGSSGIAVGMSTNVPPHNLVEVARAAIHLLDRPDCTVADLMRFVPGPDFPTGGLIVGTQGIRQAYEKGRGRVVMRARAIREQRRGGREQLVVVAIPYTVNKTRVIEQVADLAKRGKLPDVSDLRDESDREGMRLVIELKRGGDAKKTAAALFKQTSLQATFGVITLALDRGVPREFTLKELLERFRDHRVEVVVRRSRWELERARAEAHVLEGLLIALSNIDETVRIIRGSRTRETAGRKLQKAFELSERQAEAILNMRLVKLTALEGRELRDRRAELQRRIAELNEILASPERQIAEIRRELKELVEAYGDTRRTRIVEADAGLELEEQIAEEEVAVLVSHAGFAKQVPLDLFRRRAAAGRAGGGLADEDYLEYANVVNTRDVLLVFTADGRVYPLPVREIPEMGRAARGRPLHALLKLPRGTRIAALAIPSEARGDTTVVHVTAEGGVKRTTLDQFAGMRAAGSVAVALKAGERLVDVRLTDGSQDLVLATRGGRVIRFNETEATATGRGAGTVRGIRLRDGDAVVGLAPVSRDTDLCAVFGDGGATRIPLEVFPVQGRGGMGGIAIPEEDREVVRALDVDPGETLMALSAAGRSLRLAVDEVSVQEGGPASAAVLPVGGYDRIVEVTRLAEPASRPGAEPPEGEPEEDEVGDTGDAGDTQEETAEDSAEAQLEILA